MIDALRRQALPLFQNIEVLLDEFSDEEFQGSLGGFPVWRQFYHLIHSLDKNFIDPEAFEEPDFHQPGLDQLPEPSPATLSKPQLLAYYQGVKAMVQGYLDGLTEQTLDQAVVYRHLNLTRFDLILAQFRHILYHVGYLHCALKLARGTTPEYVGLYKAQPKA